MNCLPKTKEYNQYIAEKYFDMIYRLALSQCGNTHDAEDITSDVFLKYINCDKPFESEEHIKAWLIRVTVNRTKSLFTSSWFKKNVPLEETIPAQIPEEESEVYGAVMQLPQKYRAVIHLFYYEDLKTAQIAQILNIKEATVRSQLLRARSMLKQFLEGDDSIV